jgi:hypothetical protein
MQKFYIPIKRKAKAKDLGQYIVFDLETVVQPHSKHLAVVAASATCSLGNTFFTIRPEDVDDKGVVSDDGSMRVITSLLRWITTCFRVLSEEGRVTVIAHNFQDFDGFLLYPFLAHHYGPENVQPFIDAQNSFVLVIVKVKKEDKTLTLTFRCSHRLFNMKLTKLSTLFGVKPKEGYNEQLFGQVHNILPGAIHHDKFKEYSIYDSVSLHQSLLKAQEFFFVNYHVDISTSTSLSNLSFQIYLTNFYERQMPLLQPYVDKFIREAYYGGSTDVYRAYGENLHWYDINSLYPASMINPMPCQMVGKFVNFSAEKLELKDFFGYVRAFVICPKHIKYPILPVRINEPGTTDTKLIHPTGKWVGVYFSEELKNAESLGYEIHPIAGLRFEPLEGVFDKFVDHFYPMKQSGDPTSRAMAKLILNGLYGYLARPTSYDVWTNVLAERVDTLCQEMTVKSRSLLKFNKDYIMLKTKEHLSKEQLVEVDKQLEAPAIERKSQPSRAKVNIAVGAAVTAYARITMSQFKNIKGIETFYTDTDSVYTNKPLPQHLVDPKELGKMKDELSGLTVQKAHFLGPKAYGLTYEDKEGDIITRSTIAGITKDSLSWPEIVSLSEDKPVNIPGKTYLLHDIENFTIKEQTSRDRQHLVSNKPVFDKNGKAKAPHYIFVKGDNAKFKESTIRNEVNLLIRRTKKFSKDFPALVSKWVANNKANKKP